MKLTEENLNGKIFNSWRVINFHEKRKYIKYFWCECLYCHQIKSVSIQTVVSGKSKSCGCVTRKEAVNKACRKTNEIEIIDDVAKIKIIWPEEDIMLCDTEDLSKLDGLYIYSHISHNIKYAYANLDCKTIRVHRLILNIDNPKIQVDHINHNGLDNRKENLRLCTNQENNFNKNKLNTNNTSGYRGISWNKEKQKWEANLHYGNIKYMKRFNDIEKAKEWYMNKNKEVYGNFSGYNDA